jgi:3-methyladenine DNA glycosylase AlkD
MMPADQPAGSQKVARSNMAVNKLDDLTAIRNALAASANPGDVPVLQRFFKTGPDEYAEGDLFIGVRVPATRAVLRRCGAIAQAKILALLHSPIHEERLLALLLWVRDFERGDSLRQQAIYRSYLANTEHVNNWDLVDVSAYPIVGGWLLTRSRAPLARLAGSSNFWERRIAVLATFRFIKQGESADTLALAERLLEDPHELIHKAVGWMLREVGKRVDTKVLEAFLDAHANRMPRTMLRYAIERLPERKRRGYLLR